MELSDTQALLKDYVQHRSESAFRGLLVHYVDLVYSTALRRVDGHVELAKDVTQTVFIQLARNHDKLTVEGTLGGWLLRTTCNVASNLLRGERRRQQRERQAAAMNTPHDHTAANLAELAPILDDAIDQLAAEDRT